MNKKNCTAIRGWGWMETVSWMEELWPLRVSGTGCGQLRGACRVGTGTSTSSERHSRLSGGGQAGTPPPLTHVNIGWGAGHALGAQCKQSHVSHVGAIQPQWPPQQLIPPAVNTHRDARGCRVHPRHSA